MDTMLEAVKAQSEATEKAVEQIAQFSAIGKGALAVQATNLAISQSLLLTKTLREFKAEQTGEADPGPAIEE
ncbi:MAG TPA: hypothetical protein PK788_09185 [Gemmatimonadaceae bacterium]|nr:hypothetical protein [Gemmatimonadaceae bacterium]